MKKPLHKQAKTTALAPRKKVREVDVLYQPPPPRRNFRYDDTPGIDPQTRHALVTLADKVTEIHNLEDRIGDLSSRVKNAENHMAQVPETWWQRLQSSIAILQKEFNDRVPALERHYANVDLLLSRMKRLEERMDSLELKPK